jgi:Holliday junction resolvase-like predicted endonuclease
MNWTECLLLPSRELGRFGESQAAAFFARIGIPVVDRNVRVGDGELDLIALIDGCRTAVEVRSIRRPAGSVVVAIDAFGPEKARQVRKLAFLAGCERVDLVSVCFRPEGVDLHWLPRVA